MEYKTGLRGELTESVDIHLTGSEEGSTFPSGEVEPSSLPVSAVSKSHRKHISAIALGLVGLSAFIPRFVLASLTFENPLTSIDTLPEFIDALLTIVIQIAIPIIVIMIIYAGFLLITARGDQEKLKRGRMTFLTVIIGATIILGAKLLASGIQGTIEALSF